MNVVPRGWRRVRLAEVAEQCLGKMLDAKKNKGRPLPYLRNPNVRWFDVDTSDLREMPFEDRELDRYGLRAGDVLVCEGGEAGRAAIWDGRLPEVKFQKAIHRVRTGPELHNRYLVYRLMADYQSGRLADYYTGATIKHLTGQDLARYELPLPPIEVQRRIADVLDRAEALRAKRRAALAQLDTLTQSIFLDLFGDPVTNPKAWPLASLGDMASRVTKGESPKWQGHQYQDEGALFVTSENVRLGEIDLGEPKFVPIAFHEKLSRSALQKGDLLVNLVGASIGRSCVFPGWNGPANVNQAVAVITLDSRKVSIPFVANYLASQRGQSLLLGNQVEAARANISLGNLRDLKVPLPPPTLQTDFAMRALAVESLKSTQRRSLAELDALFASLQHRAFRGEL